MIVYVLIDNFWDNASSGIKQMSCVCLSIVVDDVFKLHK